MQAKQIFVNMVVGDLERSKKFWSALGFSINPQFTDENAFCLVLGDNIFAMLMTRKTMKRFTKKTIADATTTTEAINAISVESRTDVDNLYAAALTNGGSEVRPADDYGWMYSKSFQDPDGHMWEILYMDISKAPPHP